MKAQQASLASAENQARKHYQRAQAHGEEASNTAQLITEGELAGHEKEYRRAAEHQKASDMHMKVHSSYDKSAKAFKAGKIAQGYNHYQKAVDMEEELTAHKKEHGGLPLKHTSLSDHAGSAEDEVAPASSNPTIP